MPVRLGGPAAAAAYRTVNSCSVVDDDVSFVHLVANDEARFRTVCRALNLRPPAPADRTLRETAHTKELHGRIWFSHDARTLAHGGCADTDLSLWDLSTGQRQLGVSRATNVISSALSPDGRSVAVASADGLALYNFAAARADGDACAPSCEVVWEAGAGTHYTCAVFSRDGALLASMRDGGVVEVRNAQTSHMVARAQFEDFPGFDGNRGENPSGMDFSPKLLAVGGKDGKPNSDQVQLYTIGGGIFVRLVTLELGGGVNNLRFDRSGRQLAVGVLSGTRDTLLFAAGDDGSWSAPPLRLVTPGGGHACDTAFSHDGRLLCVSYAEASFGAGSKFHALWDLEAGAIVRAIRGCGHHACAFSPADELLAVGGDLDAVHIRELLPTSHLRLASYGMPRAATGGGEGETLPPLTAAWASAEVTVLVRGTQLAALDGRDGGKVLWQINVGEDAVGAWYCPLALQPGGEQLVVCVASKPRSLSLRCLRTGVEQHRLQLADALGSIGVSYSPDGGLLLASDGFAIAVFDAKTGTLKHKFAGEAKAGNVIGLPIIDKKNRFLVAAGEPAASFITDLRSGEIVDALPHFTDNQTYTFGPTFDDAGERLAYTQAPAVCIVAVDGWRETLHFTIPGYMWGLLQFSPGAGEYLLVVSGTDNRWWVVRAEDGEQPAWSKCLRSLTLPVAKTPAKNVNGEHLQSLRWVRPRTQTSSHEGDGTSRPLLLQMVVDDQLHVIDVSAFICSFEQDGNFSVVQLNGLSDVAPDAIEAFAEKWPYAINLVDPETKDTVLHHCARTLKRQAVFAWIGGGVPFTPLRNYNGVTAIGEAVATQQAWTAKELLKRLDPKLALARTDTVTADLVAIGEKWPGKLLEFVQLLEAGAEDGFTLFRTMRELDVLRKQHRELEVRASEDASGAVPWEPFEGEDATVKCDSELYALALRGFASSPPQDGQLQLPPYTRLFNSAAQTSDEQLSLFLQTKLMVATTMFKWETYGERCVRWKMVAYLLHLGLAAVTLVASTQLAEWHGVRVPSADAANCDALQVALLLSNFYILYQEYRQMSLMGSLSEYLASGWNVANVGGIAALNVAAFAHFAHASFWLQQAGAIAVLLNAFSFLEYLALYERTGTMILVIVKATSEVTGFTLVMLVLIWGFSASFAVSMPGNAAFITTNAAILPGLFTTTMAMVGDFGVDDYENPLSIAVFLIFLFIMIIVMFNVLIAIVSDVYACVAETAAVEVRKLRAQRIIDEEAAMSGSDRNNPAYFPEFLEVLQEEPKVEPRPLEELSSRVCLLIQQSDGKVDELAKEVADLKAMQIEHMAQIKALLEKSLQ